MEIDETRFPCNRAAVARASREPFHLQLPMLRSVCWHEDHQIGKRQVQNSASSERRVAFELARSMNKHSSCRRPFDPWDDVLTNCFITGRFETVAEPGTMKRPQPHLNKLAPHPSSCCPVCMIASRVCPVFLGCDMLARPLNRLATERRPKI